jgi:hypothetical protein
VAGSGGLAHDSKGLRKGRCGIYRKTQKGGIGMSNPKHVQLKPEDAAKIVEVLADVETTAPRYFKKQGLSLQLMRLKREVRRVHAQYEREDEE